MRNHNIDTQCLSPYTCCEWTWLKSLHDNYVYNRTIRVNVQPNLPDALGLCYCAILSEDERLNRLHPSDEFFRLRWQICLLFCRGLK